MPRTIGAPNELKAFEVSLHGSKTTTRYELNRYNHRMVHEFQAFAKMYQEGDYAGMEKGLNVSVAVMKTAEKARKAAGIVFGCDKQ